MITIYFITVGRHVGGLIFYGDGAYCIGVGGEAAHCVGVGGEAAHCVGIGGEGAHCVDVDGELTLFDVTLVGDERAPYNYVSSEDYHTFKPAGLTPSSFAFHVVDGVQEIPTSKHPVTKHGRASNFDG